MRVLAIETASENCSIALIEGGGVIAHDHRQIGRGHAEALVPMIAGLPGKGRADRILVSLGPGSFTGVRIGLATARALGFAWGAEVLGYPTLALLAAQAQAVHPDTAVTVCTNGGHGEWFMADFGVDGLPVADVVSLGPDAARARGCEALVAGNRAQALAALHPDRPINALDLLPEAAATTRLPDALLTRDLAPIYGRGPDATPIKDRRAP
jgi:tRNA threonylcarbamoyl adenosine modification protein YeaZ